MESAHPLRRWRKANSKTLAELGAAVGVVPSYISAIETNPEKQPSLTVAARLSEVTGIPIEQFVARAG